MINLTAAQLAAIEAMPTVTVDAFAPITKRTWLALHAEATGQDAAALLDAATDLDTDI